MCEGNHFNHLFTNEFYKSEFYNYSYHFCELNYLTEHNI